MKPAGYEAGRSIRSCSTSMAARTRSTTKAGSTNSRASRRRRVRALHESARLERLRRRLHVFHARPLGAEDYEDLMKAVDIVAKRPDVDSTRWASLADRTAAS
jgi:hypothetical protein